MHYVGALHVLAADDLNLIVELVPAERHAQRADRSHEKRRRGLEEQPSHCSSGSDANVPRQCCQRLAFAACLQISIIDSPGRRYASVSGAIQLVKHLSVSYDGVLATIC
jgi:hypothetical protein